MGSELNPEWLKALGAYEVISREDAAGDAARPLEKTRWAGAVDCVGGDTLAGVLRGLKYGAAVAASGNTGGVKLPATVLPFILRGVSLLGIHSVECPRQWREDIWRRLSGEWKPRHLDLIATRTVTLDELPSACTDLIAGTVTGRVLVKIG